ncbi:MAG: SCO family protein [Cocleimonas sp.]|nr:SCO family protein [Cocleimonas sp.]
MHIKKQRPLLLIALLAILLLWAFLFWNPADNQSLNHQPFNLVAEPKGGDFTIETKDKELSLNDLRGKVVVLYFGYTLCPDVCPTSLAILTQALNQMTEQELSELQSIFISVDPDRDNLTRLDQYTKYFHANMIGGTAEKVVIDRIAQQYGAAYQKVESNSAAGYLVDHSSYTYVIDKKGKLRHSLAHGTAPDKVLEAVRELLAE